MKINRKTASKVIWILVALLCTAFFLYMFVGWCESIVYSQARIQQVQMESDYNDADTNQLLQYYNSTIRFSSLMSAFTSVWYAAFAVLIIQKLISLFRRPSCDNRIDAPRE